MKRTVPPLGVLFCLVAVLALSSTALASAGMHSANFSIPWSAAVGGSENMASTHLQMRGTVMMGAIGQTQSEHFELSSGYWPGALDYGDPVESMWTIYLPLTLRGP